MITAFRVRWSIAIVSLVAAALGAPELAFGTKERSNRDESKTKISETADDDLVRMIGSVRTPQVTTTGLIVVDISETKDSRNDSSQFRDISASGIPLAALWPDADGMIIFHRPNTDDQLSKAMHRNPWEIDGRLNAVKDASTLTCGGVIIGAANRQVAFLNDRVVRLGDKCGAFSVIGIYRLGLVLERNGISFVVPRGRRVIVSLSGI